MLIGYAILLTLIGFWTLLGTRKETGVVGSSDR